ncbi:MAG: hypothetical protein Q7J78_06370, partial [Clostridiales bacterium]|nr:hypothetical protein [Clostridiales bacterium]
MAKKDSAGNKQAKIAFTLGGEVSTEKDPDPSAVGIYKVKDEKLKELEDTPLSALETGGTYLNAELLRAEDLEHIKARQNVRKNVVNVNANLDFKLSDNITFRLGGNVAYDNHHAFAYEYALINPSHNSQNISSTKRIYGKLTHKLGKGQSKDDKTTSLFQNAYYTLQVGYTKYKETVQDDIHKDKLFDYGYIGKFENQRARAYSLDTNAAGDTIYEQIQWSDTNLIFTPGTQNPLAANYTTQYEDLVGAPNGTSAIQGSQYYLLNGVRPRSVYSIWYNTGRVNNQYYNIDQSQLRATGQFSADVKNHAIQLGFEYEKRDDRYWNISPIGM